MCGIAGIISLTEESVFRHEVESMCSALVHRGPDEDGFFIGTGIGMGMRRLRIIDLETGRQPVQNEDGTVWTVFNGEIYNFKELRTRLARNGHRFRTSTDTEVIVHLYEQYGARCVDYLRGMFAFAVWDDRRKTLLLARDRLGIKPLYYGVVDGRLYFASELKAILELSTIPKELDWQSVSCYARFATTPGDRSIIKGIHKLPPAHRLIVDKEKRSVNAERYWDVQFTPDRNRTEKSFVNELRHLLDESVKLHMVSDVPVGAFLSGGLDSSSVVASMCRATSIPVKTFSVGFKDAGYDELPYAREVAESLGTEHHERVIEPDVLGVLDKIVWHLDEPFGDSSAIPTYIVSQIAGENVTVVLSGDGGDELFGGYEKYLVERREQRYERLPAFFRHLAGTIGAALPEGATGKRFLSHLRLTGAERYLDSCTLFGTEQFSKLFTPDVLPVLASSMNMNERSSTAFDVEGDNWLCALQYRDIHNYLPLDILTKVDRMSMAHSIETRVPLLDHKLVEFAARIPPEMQIRNYRTKHILKAAMHNSLSDRIINRRKHGFAIPLNRWFRGQLRDFVNDTLLSATSRRRGIFNGAYVQSLLNQHASGRDLDFHLWSLLSFELWCRTFMDAQRPRTQAIRASEVLQVPNVSIGTAR